MDEPGVFLVAVGILAGALGFYAAHAETGVPVSALAFSSDGASRYVGAHHQVQIHARNGTPPSRTLKVDFPVVKTIAVHGAGWLAVGGGFPGELGSVQFMRAMRATGESASIVVDDHDDLVESAAWRPNSDPPECAAASADGSISVYAWPRDFLPAEPTRRWHLTDHAGPVTAVAYDPSGQILVSVSADRSVKVWDAVTGDLIRSLNNHTDRVHALAFRPGAVPAECATGSDDGTVRIWQPGIGRMLRIIRHEGGSTFALAYSPDGRAVFAAGRDGIIRKWDADSDALGSEWPAHRDWIYSLALSPDGTRLASGAWSGDVKIWELSERSGSHSTDPPPGHPGGPGTTSLNNQLE